LFGRVLVIGGSDSMLGAPVLAGTAALRMGSGLVQIAVPKAMLPAALSVTPELIGLARGAAIKPILDAAKQADAVVIGPGLGQSPAAKKLLLAVLKQDHVTVVDADGLNMLAAGKKWPTGIGSKAVLTPHPGEMKRLAKLLGRSDVPTDDTGRLELATLAANTFKQVVVLKGDRTVVTDGRQAYVNHTGNSSLSKAGTGDVLSGVIGSLMGQGMDRFPAAVAGVWIHGKAGETAGRTFGLRSVLAKDVIDSLPAAIAEYERVAG
jgi:NAD(P)H-hydrate epimerase